MTLEQIQASIGIRGHYQEDGNVIFYLPRKGREEVRLAVVALENADDYRLYAREGNRLVVLAPRVVKEIS